MSSRNEITDLVMEEIEKYGLKGSLEERGKHIAVVYAIPNGERRTIFCSRTPSDWRAAMKARQVVRAYMREDNIPLKQESPLSFQKAMSLPKQPLISPAQRDEILHKDVSLISELVFELQEQNAVLLEQMKAMLEKMNSIQVVSTVMSNVSFTGQPQAEQPVLQPKVETQPLIRRNRVSTNQVVLNHVPYVFTKAGLIVDIVTTATGISRASIYQSLRKLETLGLVEHSIGGRWKRIQNDNVVVLGSGDQVTS